MEVQVGNKVKKINKQINKENKRKNAYVENCITEKLRKWRKYWKRKNLI